MTNNFVVKIDRDIFKYDLTLSEGNINEHLPQIKKVLFSIKENREIITRNFGQNFLLLGSSIYTLQMIPDPLYFDYTENVQITIQYDQENSLKEETKTNIIGRLIKIIQKKMRFKLVGRKHFNPRKMSTIRSFEIWPGYQTSFSQIRIGDQQKNILNIDLVHKVITNENVLNKMEEIRQKYSNNFEGAIT